jgi:N-acetyl-beta-hexosaminidase
MINLLPTPKQYEILDEKCHAIALGVTTDVADWADIVEGFCESFEKIFEEKLPVTADAGIVLVKDDTVAANAYAIDSTDKLIIRASAREGVLYGLASTLQLVQLADGKLSVQSLKICDRLFADNQICQSLECFLCFRRCYVKCSVLIEITCAL